MIDDCLAFVTCSLLGYLVSVAYAETFHGGGFHSVADDGHLYLVCAVCDITIWRHIDGFKRSLLT